MQPVFTSSTGPSGSGATVRRASLLRALAVGAVVAALVNATIWVGARAMDVSFMVMPPQADAATRVGLVAVVLTTLLMFGVGGGLLALVARRSRRGATGVIALGALVAVLSAGPALVAAQDTATGLLLATMHLMTGTVFVVTASGAMTRARF